MEKLSFEEYERRIKEKHEKTEQQIREEMFESRNNFQNDVDPHCIDTRNAKCPYCHKDEQDSWEIPYDTEHTCKYCGEEYWVESQLVRQFTTYKKKGKR